MGLIGPPEDQRMAAPPLAGADGTVPFTIQQ
jgi:hypothetical protein